MLVVTELVVSGTQCILTEKGCGGEGLAFEKVHRSAEDRWMKFWMIRVLFGLKMLLSNFKLLEKLLTPMEDFPNNFAKALCHWNFPLI